MEKSKNKAGEYTLLGSDEKENTGLRIDFSTALLNRAERRSLYLGELRQKNVYYALVTFAGLFTVGLSLKTRLYSLLVSLILFLIMVVFCLLDLRLHKYVHGWRKTEKLFIGRLNELINDPSKNVTFLTYAEDGERDAEKFVFQPIIFYLLVFGGFLHFLYSCINLIKR